MDPNSNNFQNNSNNNNNFDLNPDEWRKQMWIEFQKMSSQLPSQLSQNISRNETNDVDNEKGDDDDVVETPSLGVQPSNKRVMNKNHFSLAEDEALISSFIQHSQDPTIGTNQKKRYLWIKVKNLFDEARKANPSQIRERSVGMLETARRKTSGMSEEDVIKEAIKTHNGPDHIISDDEEGSISKRPMDIKAAKMNKGKGKVNAVQMEFIVDAIKEARKQKQIEIELMKLELDEKHQQDGERAMKWSVLQTLLQRSDLNPQEEELKMTLLKDLSVI
ncbi:hypothetical protein RND81_11G179800 [Saponaria officinalis]|uniref:Myb-like domain-containing protein n=1 Tax=Saponaria officinalis TaxID=3572 RepID=A0AAW1HP27_SAPOF